MGEIATGGQGRETYRYKQVTDVAIARRLKQVAAAVNGGNEVKITARPGQTVETPVLGPFMLRRGDVEVAVVLTDKDAFYAENRARRAAEEKGLATGEGNKARRRCEKILARSPYSTTISPQLYSFIVKH